MSSPKGLDALNLQQEMSQLRAACRGWKGVEVTFLEDADAPPAPDAARKPFHVLHFMGHGGFDEATGQGVLYFTKADKSLEALSGEALSTLLKDSKSLGLVLLNACETARLHAQGTNPFSGVANALVLGGLAAVIAMQFPISDEAAIAFSSAFYQQLAAGDAVDTAVVEGRRAVLSAASQTQEWGTPVLFLRVPDAHVFHKRGRGRPAGEESYSPWSPGKVALLLAIVLAVTAAGFFIVRGWNGPLPDVRSQIAAAKGYSFDLDHAFSSTQDGLVGLATRVEMAGNGRMRMYFRFRNKSKKDVGLGLNYRSTYLADAEGNRYAVLGADAPAKGGETAVERIQPGQEIERWIEFPAPLDQAKSFQVGLAGTEGGAQFPLFPVEIKYPKELSIASPVVKIDPKSKILPVSQPFTTNVDGFQGSVRHVELRDNTRMRWSFAFLNKSARDQTVSFEYDNIYLQDELGNRYKVITSDTGGGPGRYYQESLQRAVRADHWFEFEAPVNGARNFTIVLASHDRHALAFNPFKIRMPYYPPSYSRVVKPAPAGKTPVPQETPKPQEALPAAATAASAPAATPPPEPPKEVIRPDRTITIQKADTQWGTSVKGFGGRLLAIESLADGRVRWTFEFTNQTGGALEFGLNLKATYLADEMGHRYSVARADTGLDHPIYQETLQNGRSVSHWIEFPGPANGAHKFIAVLTSHAPNTLRFLPFQAELPEKVEKPK